MEAVSNKEEVLLFSIFVYVHYVLPGVHCPKRLPELYVLLASAGNWDRHNWFFISQRGGSR